MPVLDGMQYIKSNLAPRNILQYDTAYYNAIQYKTIQYLLQCNKQQCIQVHNSIKQCKKVYRHSAMYCNTRKDASQYCPIRHRIQYSVIL